MDDDTSSEDDEDDFPFNKPATVNVDKILAKYLQGMDTQEGGIDFMLGFQDAASMYEEANKISQTRYKQVRALSLALSRLHLSRAFI